MNDIIFVPDGLLGGVVCAPKSLSEEEVVRLVNVENPSGTRRGWSISNRKTLEDGTPLPAPCLEDSDRLHYYLEA